MGAHGDDVNPANGHGDVKLIYENVYVDVSLKALNLNGNDYGDHHHDYACGHDPLNRDDVNGCDLQ